MIVQFNICLYFQLYLYVIPFILWHNKWQCNKKQNKIIWSSRTSGIFIGEFFVQQKLKFKNASRKQKKKKNIWRAEKCISQCENGIIRKRNGCVWNGNKMTDIFYLKVVMISSTMRHRITSSVHHDAKRGTIIAFDFGHSEFSQKSGYTWWILYLILSLSEDLFASFFFSKKHLVLIVLKNWIWWRFNI